jgi:hypothetical protein
MKAEHYKATVKKLLKDFLNKLGYIKNINYLCNIF